MYPWKLRCIFSVILYFLCLFYISEGSFCEVENHCVNLEKCPFIYDMMHRANLTLAEKTILRKSICDRKTRSMCCPIDLPKPSECGIYYPAFDKVYGGVSTALEEYPWTVLLKKKGGTFMYQLCAGSLINKRYILTAAHCIKHFDVETLKVGQIEIESVLLGEWNKTTEIDCLDDHCADPTVEIGVEKVIVHDGYLPETSSPDDIALIRLVKEVNYTRYIQPICLPLENNLKNNLFDRITTFTVVGWGKTEKTNYTSEVKLKATIPSFNRRRCTNIYRTKYDTVIINRQICAGGEANTDSCKGDSGGPLVGLNYENIDDPRHFLAGIVSFGPYPCAKIDVPAVYTRVGAYIDWILDNIEP